MSQFKTPLEVYKLLPQTNCKQCYLPSCLAFAAAVIKGDKELGDCPPLDRETARRYGGRQGERQSLEKEQEAAVARLQEEVKAVDFATVAGPLGGRLAGERLVLNCLGKDFMVEKNGTITSACHCNAWLMIPILNYILKGRGKEPTGRWLPFRELAGGQSWQPLFGQRCESDLKKLADSKTELFGDIVELFNGKRPDPSQFSADIAVILHPLPRLPMLICYWNPEDDLASDLNVFFDETAPANLPIGSIYTLGVGMVRMFEKISHSHS